MIRLFLLVCITSMQLCFCYIEEEFILKETGFRLCISYKNIGDWYKITTNKNKTFTCIKKKTCNDINKLEHVNVQFVYGCNIEITLSTEDTGLWIISNYNKTFKYDITVVDKIKNERILPKSSLKVYTGDFVFAELPISENITNCFLIKETYNLPKHKHIKYNVWSREADFYEQYKKCGVRMKIEPKHHGNWLLYATIVNKMAYIGHFSLDIEKEDNEESKVVTKSFKRNSTISWNSLYNKNCAHCELIDPHGNIVQTKFGRCDYVIRHLASYHEGLWTYRYYLQHKQEPLNLKINISIYDEAKIISRFSKDNDGNINLLCSCNKNDNIQSCRFQSPTNEIISLSPGVGSDKYEYYGNGFGNDFAQDCGIKIRNPTTNDHGLWKCLITNRNSKIVKGSILYTKQPPKIPKAISEPEQIYVQRKDPFMIKCKTNVTLSYCWLMSPNGTFYPINIYNTQPGSLLYHGTGLSLGECGTIVPNADEFDRGEWSCHMGISDGSDVKSRVTVFVTDSLIMPEQKEINIISSDTMITLTCGPIPGAKFDIDICRWIKPNGTKIMKNVDSRYNIEQNKRYCKLHLTISDKDIYEHTGCWTCIIYTEKYTNKEFKAYINVYHEGSNIALIIGGSCVFIVLLIAIFAIVTYNIKRRSNNNDKDVLVRHLN